MKGILSMKEKEQKELFASLVKGFEKLLLYGKNHILVKRIAK